MTLKQALLTEPRRWAMFIILLVGALLPPLDFLIVNVALPLTQQEFASSSSVKKLVISSYAAVYAVTLITGGRLGDLYGRGKMFFLGLIGFAAASLLCGLAWSPWLLIVGRIMQGATAAIMAPHALASIQVIFPEAEKPLALSLYGAVFGLASVIWQALGGVLISLDLYNLGWRLIFLVNLPVVMFVVLFGLPLLKETRARNARKLGPISMILATAMLSALIISIIEGREAGWPWWSLILFLTVPLLAFVLWRYELHLSQNGGSPLLDPVALRSPGLGQGLAMPVLMRMITGRVAPKFSGMISGVTSCALQISAALSVALIGGIFYSTLGDSHSGADIIHAFGISTLAIALCLALGAALSVRLIQKPATRVSVSKNFMSNKFNK